MSEFRSPALISIFATLLLGSSCTNAQKQSRDPSQPFTAPAGTTRVNPKDGLTYVWIPPGMFTMGCSAGDTECADDEKPAHQVTLTYGFWIGKTEVTEKAYQNVTGKTLMSPNGPSFPVGGLTWEDAGAYCRAVGMRLPTEAEWEYAARAGNPSARYGPLEAVAWFGGGPPHEAAQKQANAYGLQDTLGNLWEYTADYYDAHYYATSPAKDPPGPSNGRDRTLRGGSWHNEPSLIRVSVRHPVSDWDSNPLIGFRCDADEKPLPPGQAPPLPDQRPAK